MSWPRAFLAVWLSQGLSLLGSTISTFALTVWLYQRTGSVTQFAFGILCGLLPRVVLAPLAGAVVDRASRRHVMLLSDSANGLGTLVVAVLHGVGALAVWHIYVVAVVASACGAFQSPAYAAAVPMLVGKAQLSRANAWCRRCARRPTCLRLSWVARWLRRLAWGGFWSSTLLRSLWLSSRWCAFVSQQPNPTMRSPQAPPPICSPIFGRAYAICARAPACWGCSSSRRWLGC
ncbi:MAG: MFS transporter [Anaerolineae bacterium]|nr:MFS transporter [Anaerolineae bacterium]